MRAKRVVKKVSQRKWKLGVVWEPLEKLKMWEKNPRHNDEAADKLCVLLERYGFVNPIIATPDGIIRAGHTRYKAAAKLGYEEVPVIYVPFESQEEAEMFSLSDNKSSEWAEWNMDLLADAFDESHQISTAQLAHGTGFSQLEIQGIQNEYGLADSPEDVTADMLPDPLGHSEVEGLDATLGRVIIVFYDEEERDAVTELLGISLAGASPRQVWRVGELGALTKRKARRVES